MVKFCIVTGFVGGDAIVETIVAWNALSNITSPPSLKTVITPDGPPNSSGSKTTNDLPNSSIVVVKSVPLTAIVAVGV